MYLDFTPNAGTEQGGRRPALVLSPKNFNIATGLMLTCPITNQLKGGSFEVQLPRGVRVTGAVLSDHIRSVDWIARNAEYYADATEDLMCEVLGRVEAILPLIAANRSLPYDFPQKLLPNPWHGPDQSSSSLALAAAHPELLEAWRPLAQDFDVFFGLEAATNEGLNGLVKDTTVDRTIDAVAVARDLRYGVTGNFVIDPDWGEADFERLWSFVAEHDLGRAGFTILTPLPGTAFFDERGRASGPSRWSQNDITTSSGSRASGVSVSSISYCETWRRSILNLSGHKSWLDWARQVRARDLPFVTRMLLRTQRMMRPEAYLREHRWPGRTEAFAMPADGAVDRLGPDPELRAGCERSRP